LNTSPERTTGVLLINLGTPDSPKVSDVRRYLSEFLNDPRVIDIPWLPRKMLVNLIIVPFRAPKSAKIYQELWDRNNGQSPLLVHSRELTRKLQAKFPGGKIHFHLAMRYGNPSIASVLEEMYRQNYDEIIVVPLYPQYASASSGSTVEEVMRIMKDWYVMPEVRFTGQFYDRQEYINCFVQNARKFDLSSYDHFVFSYHGLPERQVDKVYETGLCTDRDCEHEVNQENKLCYKATCFDTTRRLMFELGLAEDRVTTCFQSRLDKNWIRPFSDDVLRDLAKNGNKKVLVFSPAFVADCLETLIEIEEEYLEIFTEHGGETLHMVKSLNAEDYWVDALVDIIGLRGN
jgi:ferrochelatase